MVALILARQTDGCVVVIVARTMLLEINGIKREIVPRLRLRNVGRANLPSLRNLATSAHPRGSFRLRQIGLRRIEMTRVRDLDQAEPSPEMQDFEDRPCSEFPGSLALSRRLKEPAVIH